MLFQDIGKSFLEIILLHTGITVCSVNVRAYVNLSVKKYTTERGRKSNTLEQKSGRRRNSGTLGSTFFGLQWSNWSVSPFLSKFHY